MIFEIIHVGAMAVNCYVLAREEGAKAIIIDPGDQERKITQVLKKHNLIPGIIINTHGHYDHIGADDKFAVPVYIHDKDAEFLKDPMLNLSGLFSKPFQFTENIKILKDGELIAFEGIELEVIHLPGHTPGGIALLMKKPEGNILFSGDTLFNSGIGRCDLAGGDEDLLFNSIKEKLFKLDDRTIVYPGHGDVTTIGDEKKRNPYLNA